MAKRLKNIVPVKNFIFTPEDDVILKLGADKERGLEYFSQWFFDDTKPTPWQNFFHHAPQKRKILVAGIRSGKTYCVSLGFPHYAMYHPYSHLANASISADQAKIVFYNVLDLVSRSRFEKYVASTNKHPYPVIELINGSQMWFRSVGYEAELWRGWEFDWINIDEAAYIGSKNTYDTLAGRLLGRNNHLNIPRDRLLTMTTSPKGRSWLYEEWKKGDPNFEDVYDPKKHLSLRVRTLDNPYLDPYALEALMGEYSERQRQQELEGLFLDPEDAIFSWDMIRWMCDPIRPEVKRLMDEVDQLAEYPDANGVQLKSLNYEQGDYHKYQLPPGQNRMYIISWDIGTTATRHMGRNATVGMVIDITELPWRMIAFRRETQASYALIIQWIKEWHTYYNNRHHNSVQTVVDASGSGKAVQQILQDEYNLDIDGVTYNTTTKPDVISAGQVCIERQLIITPPIRALNDELSGYEIDDKRIVQDCVMAFCQGMYVARERDAHLARQAPEILLPTRGGWQRKEVAEQRYVDRRMGRRQNRTNRR